MARKARPPRAFSSRGTISVVREEPHPSIHRQRRFSMMKKLMISTALSGLMFSAALAQAPSSPPSATDQTKQPSMSQPAPASSLNTPAPATAPNFVASQKPDQWLASKFKGTDVLGADNQKIGDVSDILFDKSGKVDAIIVSVGGFLGLGSKHVAIAPSAFDVVKGQNDTSDKLKISATKDQLEQAQNFGAVPPGPDHPRRGRPQRVGRPGDTSIVQYAPRQQPVIRSGESPERVSSDAARPGQKNRDGTGCVAGKQIPRPNRFLSRDSETSWSTGTQRLAESGWYHRRQLFESKIVNALVVD